MHQITGGSVTYLRRVKTGDFEHAEAKAEINFSSGEDGEISGQQLLAMAGMLAHKQVFDLLGLKGTFTPTPPAPAKLPEATAAATPPAGDPPPEKKKPGRPPGTSNKVKLEPRNAPVPPLPPVDAAAMPEEVPMDTPADSMDELDIGLDTPAPAEITDAQLQEAVTAHNAKVQNPTAIRKLIGEYVQPPGRLPNIKQEMRQDFLDKLSKIPALA